MGGLERINRLFPTPLLYPGMRPLAASGSTRTLMAAPLTPFELGFILGPGGYTSQLPAEPHRGGETRKQATECRHVHMWSYGGATEG